jgi:hypothetical protein
VIVEPSMVSLAYISLACAACAAIEGQALELPGLVFGAAVTAFAAVTTAVAWTSGRAAGAASNVASAARDGFRAGYARSRPRESPPILGKTFGSNPTGGTSPLGGTFGSNPTGGTSPLGGTFGSNPSGGTSPLGGTFGQTNRMPDPFQAGADSDAGEALGDVLNRRPNES